MSFKLSPLALSFVLALLAALLSLACGSRQPQGSPTPEPVATAGSLPTPVTDVVHGSASVTIEEKSLGSLTRLVVIPRNPVVAAGDTMLFSVLAYDETGKPMPQDELDLGWRTLDPLVGTITSAGLFRAGIQRGVFNSSIEVTVTQTLGGKTVTLQELASVSVIRPLSENDISRVEVLPGGVQMQPESQMVFTPLAVDRSGVPVPGVDYTWEVLDPRAGKMEPDGRFVSGVTEGSFPAALRVVAQKRTDPSQTAVSVVPVTVMALGRVQPPSKVNLYPQGISVRSGDTVEFRALALDPLGNLVQDVETTWRLRDPQAGELDNSGHFRAGQTPGTYPAVVETTVRPLKGEAPVTLRATATVTVLASLTQPERLQSLTLAPQVLRLRPGESRRIVATALSATGESMASAAVEWSGDPRAIRVTQEGVVTALDRPGSYPDAVTVVVTAGEGEGRVTQKASATVIVLGPLARIDVIPSEASVAPRQAVQFTFIAYDVNGTRLFDVLATWEILDSRAGVIDNLGFFIAGTVPGRYRDVVRVVVRPMDLDTGGR
ncbi:MAG: hypothetical protein HY680_05785 [Chloroflexi bacterium]|nr:hypothetical protein [Chloroflexota bacterium]